MLGCMHIFTERAVRCTRPPCGLLQALYCSCSFCCLGALTSATVLCAARALLPALPGHACIRRCTTWAEPVGNKLMIWKLAWGLWADVDIEFMLCTECLQEAIGTLLLGLQQPPC